jgi:uncharacterized membrane protein YeaQ/YmgE (transglycosylase-associated protein family)
MGFAEIVGCRARSRTNKSKGKVMEMIGTLISWAVFGLVIGLIARLLYPGRQSMGFIATMALGMAGSFMGGLISWAFGFDPGKGAFRESGWIMSIIGAMIVVWIGLYVSSRTTTTGTRPTV